jgi:hypothetical protein
MAWCVIQGHIILTVTVIRVTELTQI